MVQQVRKLLQARQGNVAGGIRGTGWLMKRLAHRPQAAWRSLKLSVVYREWQPCLIGRATCAWVHERTRAERIIEIGWVHCQCTARRCARLKPCCSVVHAAPSLDQCAEAGAVLQAAALEASIQVTDARCTHAAVGAERCELDALPPVGSSVRTSAVRCRIVRHIAVCTTADLKTAFTHNALDDQSRCFDSKRI